MLLSTHKSATTLLLWSMPPICGHVPIAQYYKKLQTIHNIPKIPTGCTLDTNIQHLYDETNMHPFTHTLISMHHKQDKNHNIAHNSFTKKHPEINKHSTAFNNYNTPHHTHQNTYNITLAHIKQDMKRIYHSHYFLYMSTRNNTSNNTFSQHIRSITNQSMVSNPSSTIEQINHHSCYYTYTKSILFNHVHVPTELTVLDLRTYSTQVILLLDS